MCVLFFSIIISIIFTYFFFILFFIIFFFLLLLQIPVTCYMHIYVHNSCVLPFNMGCFYCKKKGLEINCYKKINNKKQKNNNLISSFGANNEIC